MASSKPGYILALIGGILGVFMSLVFLTIFIIAFSLAEIPGASIWVIILIFVYLAATGGLTIWGGTLMRDPKTTEKGGIIALIFSVIGSGNILGIVGGILGIVEGGKE